MFLTWAHEVGASKGFHTEDEAFHFPRPVWFILKCAAAGRGWEGTRDEETGQRQHADRDLHPPSATYLLSGRGQVKSSTLSFATCKPKMTMATSKDL